MSITDFLDPLNPDRLETEKERLSRVERETAIIAKAHADIDSGLGIDGDDLERWLDALDRDPNTPLPLPRSRSSTH